MENFAAIAIGIVCILLGISHRKGNLSALHSYHRKRVKEEDVLFCDDNLHAVKTAKAARLTVCGVYDERSREYADEMKAAADYYIQDFSELLRLETGSK